MKYRNLLVSALVLVCAAFIVYYFYDYYKIPDPPDGDRVTDITAPGIDGKPVSLSALDGHWVLIDFWASWCGPCRYENPQWTQLYAEFHDTSFRGAEGFEIFSISLDVNRTAWLGAIKQDGLMWPYHVSDLRGWNNSIAVQFGIRSIPANILIDAGGRVVGKNMSAGQVRAILKKNLL